MTYQNKPLKESLFNYATEELNKAACETFVNILKYMGEYPTAREPESIIQEGKVSVRTYS